MCAHGLNSRSFLTQPSPDRKTQALRRHLVPWMTDESMSITLAANCTSLAQQQPQPVALRGLLWRDPQKRTRRGALACETREKRRMQRPSHPATRRQSEHFCSTRSLSKQHTRRDTKRSLVRLAQSGVWHPCGSKLSQPLSEKTKLSRRLCCSSRCGCTYKSCW